MRGTGNIPSELTNAHEIAAVGQEATVDGRQQLMSGTYFHALPMSGVV
jgi:hypothetical protein